MAKAKSKSADSPVVTQEPFDEKSIGETKDDKDAKTSATTAVQQKQYNKMDDVFDFIRAGAPVLFIHDRDTAGFLSPKLSTGIGNLLDDFNIYVFMQGFTMIRMSKGKMTNAVSRQQITYTDNFNNANQAIIDPAIAVDVFLDKMPQNVVPTGRNAILILVIDPDLVDQNNRLCGTLREHYNDLVLKIQSPIVHRVDQAQGGTLADDVEEFQTAVTEQTGTPTRSVIILGSRPQVPNRIAGFCLNMGTVSRSFKSKSKGVTQLPTTLSTSLIVKEISTAQKLFTNTDENIDKVKRFRKAVFTSNGLIEDIMDSSPLSDVGGYDELKHFIEVRKKMLGEHYSQLAEKNIQLKGLFIAGVPGSGKTSILRAVGAHWGLPSYRLRLEAALGRYVGDSESALIGALESLMKLAPCFVLLDEVNESASLAA